MALSLAPDHHARRHRALRAFACPEVALEIVPTADGLITVAQAAALTNRSEITIRSWTRTGYKAPDGTRVKVKVKRRDGWLILVDPVEIYKAARATDPRGRFRAFPLAA